MKKQKKVIALTMTAMMVLSNCNVITTYAETVVQNPDITSPKLVNINIDRKELTVGDTVTITAEIEDESKIDYAILYYTSPMTSKDKPISLYLEGDKYVGRMTISDDDEYGLWSLRNIQIMDDKGNLSLLYTSDKLDFSEYDFEVRGTNPDITPPQVNSIFIDKKEVTVNDTITFSADITDQSNLQYATMYYKSPITNKTMGINLYLKNGKYVGEISIKEDDEYGMWILDNIQVMDKKGNSQVVYTSDKLDFRSCDFEIKGTNPDIKPPEVKSIEVDKNRALIGDVVTISAEIEDQSELSYAIAYYQSPITNRDKSVSLSKYGNMYRGEIKVTNKDEDGIWKLRSIHVMDKKGNLGVINTSEDLDFRTCDFNLILNTAPGISVFNKTIKVGDEFNPISEVFAYDNEDGNITSKIEILKNEVDTKKEGIYEVTYKVSDSQGEDRIKTIKVTVRSNEKPIINANDVTLKVGDEFNSLKGVTAIDKEDGEITSKIKIIENNVNTETYGVYKVVYEVSDSDNNTVAKEIKVTVNPKPSVINAAPNIEANDITIKVGDKFNPLDKVSANDNEDGNITSKIVVIKNNVDTTKAGIYGAEYKVTDSQGASKYESIQVIVRSNEKPTINANDVILKVGDKFNPLNIVTATDKEDGDLTPKVNVIENNVNTGTYGVYKVVYEVSDSDNNTIRKEIKVTVNPKPSVINATPDIEANDITIKVGDSFNPLDKVTANDKEDGDITSNIVVVKNDVDTSKEGAYEVEYKVADSQGSSKRKAIKVTVRSNEKPVISVNDITLKVGDKFNPLNIVTATDKEDGDLTSKINIIENNVNIGIYGVYKVVYEVSDSDNNAIRKEIKVTVNPLPSVINIAPNIEASDITIRVGDSFNPLDKVTANDKEDGDITSKIAVVKNNVDTTKEGTYDVEYKVTDSQGASKSKSIKVIVRSNEKPEISANDITLKVGEEFNPLNGVIAIDKEDEDITSKIKVIENTVNTDIEGTYKVVYEVIDIDENKTTKGISVKVEKNIVSESKLVGSTRYSTAVNISKRGWEKSNDVIIVNSNAMADALSATPFAKYIDAPILLTEGNSLNKETKDEILRLGAKNIYIIGGTGVISDSISSQLKSMGMKVDRISGEDRYKTSLEIAKRLGNVSEIAVVNGEKGLPDAVSIAPVAAERNMPIVLASPREGTKTFDNFIKENNIKTSYVIGKEGAVSSEMASKLPNVKRLGGVDRNETNAIILETFYTGKRLNNIFVAKDGMKNQDQLIDALAVGVLAAKENSPVVIVANELSSQQESVLSKKSANEVTQVGANGNENAYKQLVSILNR